MLKSSLAVTTLTLASLAITQGQDITLEIEIPKLEVSEYHRPYVAAWIENAEKSHVQNLLVWYQTENQKGASEKGETWLKDLRKWWRVSGRELSMPVDGMASPTRPPGKHQISITKALQTLPAGTYHVVVEATREVGGRELLTLPFDWDGSTIKAVDAQGNTELGKISLSTF